LWTSARAREELVTQALTALVLYNRDQHYVVSDGGVQIVDESTGRVMPDRSWERGLHQLIEVKEDCEPTLRRETLARLTYQRLFRRYVHLAGMTENTEDAGTLAYLQDAASQAGLQTTLIDIEDIGLRDDGSFVDLDDRGIELAFKLYPWEWMFHDAFGARLKDAPTCWIEPPWKAILSNKGILPLLWEMFPNHPNLLPAYFEDDPNAARLGTSFVRKPLYSREGANVALVSAGTTLVEQEGPYGAEGFIRQAMAPLPNFSDQYAVLGSWLVDHTPCGLSIREDENPITGNTSRFLPHAIV
jgi:glutathionylspermidine synthase